MIAGAGKKSVVIAGAIVAAGVASAQQVASDAPKLVFDILNSLQNITYSGAGNGPATTVGSTLGLTFHDKTATDSFTFVGHGLLQYQTSSLGGAGLFSVRPSLQADYSRDTGNAKLTFSGLFRRSNVDFYDPTQIASGITGYGGTVAQSGTVDIRSLSASLETGIHDPIGFLLGASASDVRYSNLNSPLLYNSRMSKIAGTTRLRPSQTTQVDLNLGYATEDDSNQTATRRRTTDVSIVVSHALSAVMVADAGVGYRWISTDQTISGATSNQMAAGLIALMDLKFKRPNGTATISYLADRDAVGLRNTLSLGRTLDLTKTTKLAASVGVAARPGGTAQPVFKLEYQTALARDTFSATADRTIALNGYNVDVAYTHVGLVYDHKINEVSSAGVSADWRNAGYGGYGAVSAVDTKSIRATYSYFLTRDWNLVAGVQHDWVQDPTLGAYQSNSVYLTLGRKYVVMP